MKIKLNIDFSYIELIFMDKLIKYWDYLSLHIWLILSSFGIMYAIISFIQDLGSISVLNEKKWIKGVISLVSGLIFYKIIGIRHIYGSQRFLQMD